LASRNPEVTRVEQGVVEVEDHRVKAHSSTVSIADGSWYRPSAPADLESEGQDEARYQRIATESRRMM
jgi:hypothetical protein